MASNPSDLFEKISSKRSELAKYRRILEILNDCSNLDPDLQDKVDYVVYSKEVAPSLKINASNINENLLGLSLNPVEITIDEQQKLWRAVRLKLLTKSDLEVGKCNQDFDFTRLSKQELDLLKLKAELDQTQKRYYENLIVYQHLLEEVLQIKLKDSKELIEKKIECSKLKFTSLELKVEILQQQTAIAVFTEISIARQAYQKVFDEIKKNQINFKREIKELEEIKEKYKLVSCKKFSDILNSYRFYKKELENKREIWDKINSV